MSIKERFKAVRNHYGLTQTDFGKNINLSRTTIAQLESGVRNITERTIIDVCREFKVDYEWLVNGVGEPFPEPTDDDFLTQLDVIMTGENELHKNMIKALVSCNEAELQALDSFINKYIKLKEN